VTLILGQSKLKGIDIIEEQVEKHNNINKIYLVSTPHMRLKSLEELRREVDNL
jgi:hypothetical protein